MIVSLEGTAAIRHPEKEISVRQYVCGGLLSIFDND
jgi:hypothetical protein